MKRFCLASVFALMSLCIFAQIPYFAGTVGKKRIYGYTSLKVCPTNSTIESYSTLQFGLGDSFAVGADVSTSTNSSYYGLLVRYGYKLSPYFQIGAQLTPSFNLRDHFKLDYITAALYLNGKITDSGNFFWVGNTWYGINMKAKDTINQWLYLGYNFRFKHNRSITPMVGCLYSWEFNRKADIAIGAYYTFSKFNLYLWSDNLTYEHPRLVLGIDFAI